MNHHLSPRSGQPPLPHNHARYDGDGRRVEKSGGTIYWYGMNGDALDETDLSGSMTNSSFSEYVFFGGKRIARRDSSGNIFYYVADHLGSSREMVQAGQTTACYDADFLPYGQEVTYTNSCGSHYKFERKERDTETGNDDFGARYYRSALGRWISPDWSSAPEPVPYANMANPQTLNLYAMVSDNPETFADLTGHIIDDSKLKNNKEYQKWKRKYLKQKRAKAQWDKLNNDKSITVHMKWDSKAMASVTGGYKWTNGHLDEATVTLGKKSGDTEYPMNPSNGYEHGATITDNSLRQVYVMAHEFAHVEYAQTSGAEDVLTDFQNNGEILDRDFKERGGIQAALRDPAVLKLDEQQIATSYRLEHQADERAWEVVKPK